MERWLNRFGTVKLKHDRDFDRVKDDFEKALGKIEGRISYGEMRMVALIAAATAVSDIIIRHTNRPRRARRKGGA